MTPITIINSLGKDTALNLSNQGITISSYIGENGSTFIAELVRILNKEENSHITELNVANCNLQNADVLELAKLKYVTKLHLNSNNLDDKLPDGKSAMEALIGRRFSWLDISNNRSLGAITGEVFKKIFGENPLKPEERLFFASTGIPKNSTNSVNKATPTPISAAIIKNSTTTAPNIPTTGSSDNTILAKMQKVF